VKQRLTADRAGTEFHSSRSVEVIHPHGNYTIVASQQLFATAKVCPIGVFIPVNGKKVTTISKDTKIQ
jgi:hypothetical protein